MEETLYLLIGSNVEIAPVSDFQLQPDIRYLKTDSELPYEVLFCAKDFIVTDLNNGKTKGEIRLMSLPTEICYYPILKNAVSNKNKTNLRIISYDDHGVSHDKIISNVIFRNMSTIYHINKSKVVTILYFDNIE
jgi:hypothetical protein